MDASPYRVPELNKSQNFEQNKGYKTIKFVNKETKEIKEFKFYP